MSETTVGSERRPGRNTVARLRPRPRQSPWAWIGTLLLCLLASGLAPLESRAEESASTDVGEKTELGRLLFEELLFTNPAMDYSSSCAGCHGTGEVEGRAPRSWADYSPTSMMANKETTTRNAQTLLDASKAERFGWDGEYDSLEQMIRAKLSSELLGWGPDDQGRAFDAIHFTLLEEGHGGGTGPSYADRFKAAYGIDIEALSRDEAIDAAVTAIADYVRTAGTTSTSKWDAFTEQNRFHPAPNEGETAQNYAFGLESRIGNQEGRRLIRLPEGFTTDAYYGFKTFMRVFGEEGQSVGNCVACHVPPYFTDFDFHDSGVTQMEYEGVHGEGSIGKVKHSAEPSAATRSPADEDDPSKIDLGWWNYAVGNERTDAWAAFKTPTLRNLAGTDPYMHNGAYATLEDVVRLKMKLGEMARNETMRGIDPEFKKVVLQEKDIPQIVEFLEQLNDVGEENFRYYLIHFEKDDLWPSDH